VAAHRARRSVLVLGVLVAAGLARPAAGEETASRGLSLFRGELPLAGRLYTQSEDMPDAVTRCANCHALGTAQPVANSTAPRLDATYLVVARTRRGVPRIAYDAAAFCALLRTGIDPAHVLISVEMPRYALGDTDCKALWQAITDSADAR
jgi:hypothetical protein